MIRTIAPTSLALLCALAISGPIVAQAYTGKELAAEGNVTLAQARAIALQAAHGTITDRELEREPGGSGVRYSFDVVPASDRACFSR